MECILTRRMASSTFSASPGFAIPSGLALMVWSFCSLFAMRFSRCGMLSLAYLSRLSNRSLMLTSESRCRFRSSSTPSSHPLASSSNNDRPWSKCLAVDARPSLRAGTSDVSQAYVSRDASVRVCSAVEKRKYSTAMPSFRLHNRSIMLHKLIYTSAERLTPERTVSNSSGSVLGRESSKSGGSGLPVNSSWTEMVACFLQTANSCDKA